MSCHSIGHGLNSVSKKVLELYDEGNLNLVLRKIYYTPQEMLYIIVMEIRMKRLDVLMDVDVLDV